MQLEERAKGRLRLSAKWLGYIAAAAAVPAILWVTLSGSPAMVVYEHDHPFLQGYELGASPGHPDRQLFTKGSDLFLSSIYLWSDTSERVTLRGASLIAGACGVLPIETKVATLGPSGPADASYIPFGYGSIHVWGWQLSAVKGFEFAPREHGASFLVFSFSDPRNCVVRLGAIDIDYHTAAGNEVERLELGGVDYIPTDHRGFYGIDVPT